MSKNKLTKDQQNYQDSLKLMQDAWQKVADKNARVHESLKVLAANHARLRKEKLKIVEEQ